MSKSLPCGQKYFGQKFVMKYAIQRIHHDVKIILIYCTKLVRKLVLVKNQTWQFGDIALCSK